MPDRPAPTLAELQWQMLAVIRGVTPDQDAGVDLATVITSDDRLSAPDRLHIYADMYSWRLAEVLRGAFPRLALLLDDDAFSDLCADYLAAHPSRHPSLRLLGQHLARFMRQQPAPSLVWAADLAALEWARYDVFDEADAPVLTREALCARAPQDFAALPVTLLPAHRWLTLDHAIEATWRALRPSEIGASAPVEAPARTPRTLLVWRQGDLATVYHRVVPPDEQALLAQARAGTTFGVLCETLAAALEARADGTGPEAAAQTAFTLLASWVGDGLLVDAAA